MRVLEIRMCEALEKGKRWRGVNTQVAHGRVFLFGTLIAWVDKNTLYIRKRDYEYANSVTTKSRIRALTAWARAEGIEIVEEAER